MWGDISSKQLATLCLLDMADINLHVHSPGQVLLLSVAFKVQRKVYFGLKYIDPLGTLKTQPITFVFFDFTSLDAMSGRELFLSWHNLASNCMNGSFVP